jgi:hypothetical protein
MLQLGESWMKVQSQHVPTFGQLIFWWCLMMLDLFWCLFLCFWCRTILMWYAEIWECRGRVLWFSCELTWNPRAAAPSPLPQTKLWRDSRLTDWPQVMAVVQKFTIVQE